MGKIEITIFDAIILAVCVAIVEWPIKKWIFKKNEKYKLLYTYAPTVLMAIAYLIIALIQKTPVFTEVLKGFSIGLASMGSYDFIVNLLQNKGASSYTEIGEAIKEKLEGKEKKE